MKLVGRGGETSREEQLEAGRVVGAPEVDRRWPLGRGRERPEAAAAAALLHPHVQTAALLVDEGGSRSGDDETHHRNYADVSRLNHAAQITHASTMTTVQPQPMCGWSTDGTSQLVQPRFTTCSSQKSLAMLPTP